MGDCMTFPDSVDEYMEQYKIVDTKEVYTNGAELVPIFRMKQWFEHLPSARPEQDREFLKLTVRNSNGRPYYSIIYLEVDDNGIGHDFEGYSSYSLDVISDYLKKYFMPETYKEKP